MNLSFTEKLIIKTLLADDRYASSIVSSVERKHFTSRTAGQIYETIQKHFSQYKDLPSADVVVSNLTNGAECTEYIQECNSIDFDSVKQFDYLIDSTDEWLKQRAIQLAIMESADVISEKESADYGKIRELIEGALTKTLKADLGLNYFDDMFPRLKRIFTETDERVPTGFPMLDDLLNGGLPPYTLSIFVGRIHGGKSLVMNNMIARQIMAGYNVVMMTLEMSEDAMAQRFDSILSGLDINRIYSTKKKDLIDKLKEIKATPGRGSLFVKQFPPKSSSVNEFRMYLHELSMRKIKPHILYCDYINLLKQSGGKNNAAMHEEITQIAEELRALSFEYKIPVVSVTQINRGGMRVGLEELDFDFISGSLGIGNTADFLAMLGLDYDSQVYKSEMMYKVCKNRIGGQVGHIGKLYMDSASLRLYDESELDIWIKDASTSGAKRDLKEKENPNRGTSDQYQKRNK